MILERLLSISPSLMKVLLKNAITPECLRESNPCRLFAARIAWNTA